MNLVQFYQQTPVERHSEIVVSGVAFILMMRSMPTLLMGG